MQFKILIIMIIMSFFKIFFKLNRNRYYKNTIFHRNIKNFKIDDVIKIWTEKLGNSIYGKKFNDKIKL